MAASSSSQADQHEAGPTWQRQETKHRQSLLHRHLNVQVPVVASTGCFAGCFRPSPTSSRSSSPSGNAHADRPASPSLIRSPSAWIRARGHSFASSARHNRRRSGDFHYDARSYARNFDEGTDGEASGDEAGLAAGDTLKYRCFSSRLPASPPPARSPSAAPACDGGNGAKDIESAREKGPDLD
ncbi:hypothetical protein E2562_031872 [Oryza meyeriana var. granulata]|uniref:Uncharacterized protein n=1 Tax=Oryza meyeriana var. granulata TaxID=110450 RepID=A0A6G1F060_9ORYZ|nr:hypothetical protein E2562_031872 [Oryza meyeriana var. granulata]